MASSPPILLALDASTRTTTVAIGDAAGACLARADDERGGRPLLVLVDRALTDAGRVIADLRAVIVGTGPGSFTGLRVGLAAAKTLAYARGIDIIGVATVEALASAAAAASAASDGDLARASNEGDRTFAVIVGAGARDHYLARIVVSAGTPRSLAAVALLPPGTDLRDAAGGDELLTIGVADGVIHGAAGGAAADLGRRAVAGLGPTLLAIGAARLAEGRTDDVATLVPEYVAVPRGVTASAKEMVWSPDPR
ncbi:MAG: tRNA (adenosine(37)-N6)-threonylcarbamoyltransferase complex dimerization subunit type 1 TsaB [Candidatus Limnocylindrales bacterium]